MQHYWLIVREVKLELSKLVSILFFPQEEQCLKTASRLVFLGKTYGVSPYDSQWSHPSMDLGVKWDLSVLFVQTAVKCQDCKFV